MTKRLYILATGLSILCFLAINPVLVQSEEQERGLKGVAVGGKELKIGSFHFLGIAIDNYRD